MGSGESNWKYSELLRMVEKNISQSQIIMRGWQQDRIANLEENGARFRGNTLLRSSSVENDDEKHHHELFRRSRRIKSEEIEPTMKRIWKILEKDIWLMVIHSYVKLRKEFDGSSGKIEESGKILGKKTCGLGPAQEKHRWKKLLGKRDCTGWIKRLEWDNILKIAWTD